MPTKVNLPRSTINLRYKPDDLMVKSSGSKKIRVIEIIPDQIVTKELIASPKIEDGQIIPDISRDILKMVVIERHRATGNVGVGFVRGFNLKAGAIGSTVAHDAHNVIVAGTNDVDILLAIRELERLQGGQIVVANGIVKAELPLPIAGLVSDQPLQKVIRLISDLNAAAHLLGCKLAAPFMALSFLSLSPIPALKLTDQGLIDATKLKSISLFV
ncbi:MAG TPA: adenine deaminase C-terminal domain-containing protein [Candidatus Saccharimonadales bacterium]|nr:adenine deaminase C-terminal domain-containing protein [Candidatus Saccharimonadales bacterium]